MPLLHISIVFSLGCIFFFVLIFLIRKRKLRERYALLWFCIALSFFCVPFLYNVLDWLWKQYVFPSPTVTLMMFTIFLLTLICLQLSVSVSNTWRHKKILMQQLTFLEQRVQELEREYSQEKK